MKKLIAQSFETPHGIMIITVEWGEKPVIATASPNKETSNSIAACALNFLHSGCPEVDIVLTTAEQVLSVQKAISKLQKDTIFKDGPEENKFTVSKEPEDKE